MVRLNIKSAVEAVLLALTGLLVALAISWLVLAKLNFSYGIWHDHAGIGAAIDRFAPSNLYRHGFHLTSRDQRIELFAGINRAIHNNGRGLAELSYSVPGHPPQSLLREPEVVHLQDVANLIDAARLLMSGVAVVWLGLWLYLLMTRRPPPSLKAQMLGNLALMAVVAAVVLAIGAVDVFYALHVWLFPKDHQWFFYYQESLMSTMMLAPNLFGWIAVEWVALTAILFVILQTGAAKIVLRLQRHRPK